MTHVTHQDKAPHDQPPVAPPSREEDARRKPGAPDLRIEEIEERHVPKDRNIFDK